MKKKAKQLKLKGKTLLSRLTGLSFPAGASWKPPPDERDIARRLLTFFKTRRALFRPYDMEFGPYVVESILKIRTCLTKDMEKAPENSALTESLEAMCGACLKFLDELQEPHAFHYHGILLSALGELRGIFGLHIARIACIYDLEVSGPLTSIIPRDPDKEFKEPDFGPTQRPTRRS